MARPPRSAPVTYRDAPVWVRCGARPLAAPWRRAGSTDAERWTADDSLVPDEKRLPVDDRSAPEPCAPYWPAGDRCWPAPDGRCCPALDDRFQPLPRGDDKIRPPRDDKLLPPPLRDVRKRPFWRSLPGESRSGRPRPHARTRRGCTRRTLPG